MILVADSGATKTDWMLVDGGKLHLLKTEGINPFHLTDDRIDRIIDDGLVARICELAIDTPVETNHETCTDEAAVRSVDAVYFYGAGCLPSHIGGIERSLKKHFPKAEIEINTDLLGAARALCNHEPGIACILGTGANSCLYDGEKIQKNVSPLGYILGDEGSGAYLGKRFVSDCFKEQLPAWLRDGLLKEFNLTYTGIINKVYKEPQANRFLASLTPYIYKQRQVPEVHDFLIDCFETFFRRNILPYHSDLPISFTGSISWYFQEEVREAAKNLRLVTSTFIQNPIEGMVIYHKVRK